MHSVIMSLKIEVISKFLVTHITFISGLCHLFCWHQFTWLFQLTFDILSLVKVFYMSIQIVIA